MSMEELEGAEEVDIPPSAQPLSGMHRMAGSNWSQATQSGQHCATMLKSHRLAASVAFLASNGRLRRSSLVNGTDSCLRLFTLFFRSVFVK